jgi:tripartite-type tricarboxylate transporter receptor subunit TctC
VKLARAKPGAVNFATVGPGSPARLLMELLKLEAKIDVTMVPYKGAGTSVGELVSGQVDAMFVTVTSVGAQVKAGRLRALAVTSARSSAVLPGIPAMSETYPGFVSEAWVGLLAPAKTPPELVARLNAEVGRILDLAETRARFAELGLEAASGSPEAFDRWIRAEMDRWGRVIRDRGITLE